MKPSFLILFFCVYSISASVVPLKERPDGRIVGGQPAFVGEFPYAAAVYTTTPIGNFFCTGTLMGTQWILTAGQCVDGVTLFTIILGTNKLDANDAETVKVATDLYFLHPDYNQETLDNDIALIKLRLPVSYSSYIKKAYLPYYEVTGGTTSTGFGWGQINDETPGINNDLHWVKLSFLSNEECRLTYGNQLTDNMICAAGNFNEGICIGDSGSPLTMYVSRAYIIVHAVATFVSGNGCGSTDPSGYTKVFGYNDWIRNVTNNEL